MNILSFGSLLTLLFAASLPPNELPVFTDLLDESKTVAELVDKVFEPFEQHLKPSLEKLKKLLFPDGQSYQLNFKQNPKFVAVPEPDDLNPETFPGLKVDDPSLTLVYTDLFNIKQHANNILHHLNEVLSELESYIPTTENEKSTVKEIENELVESIEFALVQHVLGPLTSFDEIFKESSDNLFISMKQHSLKQMYESLEKLTAKFEPLYDFYDIIDLHNDYEYRTSYDWTDPNWVNPIVQLKRSKLEKFYFKLQTETDFDWNKIPKSLWDDMDEMIYEKYKDIAFVKQDILYLEEIKLAYTVVEEDFLTIFEQFIILLKEKNLLGSVRKLMETPSEEYFSYDDSDNEFPQYSELLGKIDGIANDLNEDFKSLTKNNVLKHLISEIKDQDEDEIVESIRPHLYFIQHFEQLLGLGLEEKYKKRELVKQHLVKYLNLNPSNDLSSELGKAIDAYRLYYQAHLRPLQLLHQNNKMASTLWADPKLKLVGLLEPNALVSLDRNIADTVESEIEGIIVHQVDEPNGTIKVLPNIKNGIALAIVMNPLRELKRERWQTEPS